MKKTSKGKAAAKTTKAAPKKKSVTKAKTAKAAPVKAKAKPKAATKAKVMPKAKTATKAKKTAKPKTITVPLFSKEYQEKANKRLGQLEKKSPKADKGVLKSKAFKQVYKEMYK